MILKIEAVGDGRLNVVQKQENEDLVLLTLTAGEARMLAGMLLESTRVDVDDMRRRVRAPRPHFGEREAWSIIGTLLDEVEALRAKLRGEMAW